MNEPPEQQRDDAPKTELDRLMEAAVQDARREPEFFRALLNAVLYAHVPIDDKFAQMGDGADRVRLVMFKSPDDGTLVIPVFTDEGKAEWAARGGVRVLAVTDREFLEGTRGATLMFNPNDHRFTLYPEETAALLADSTLPPIERDKLEENQARTYRLGVLEIELLHRAIAVHAAAGQDQVDLLALHQPLRPICGVVERHAGTHDVVDVRLQI